ncbi:DNase I-like protein [Pseudovirgaria hyperparasitica]|uniref:DNase I-like protein n=1 Tax=Pseudovirgaria hyperparasitica TaxID=470096 RepID=A0A6A6VV39_9PEZI|nr:DNase I-like protein [Pseudovirgaria hyperparasitica]KAF2753584.1 DNase I-like protein [Pseudovirgaria hyperparasitica]
MAGCRPTSSTQKLNILSLNCWGLKFIAKHRNARLQEIGTQIANAEPQPDIVGLQECWTQQDYLAIRERTRHILPYGKFYHSGIFGGGLVILSRWPIEESSMMRYPLNGRPAAFYRGDWFVGKGVACARIRMGAGKRDIAEVFTTHLHAPYEREPHDSYICHRTAQAWEIAKLMRGAAERGHLVIALGDFNMIPLSLAHQLIEAHSGCRDVWRLIHPDSSIGAAVDGVEMARGVPTPSAEFNITTNGATCDSILNTWRWDSARQKDLDKGRNHHVDASLEDPRAKRLDYIFFSSGGQTPKPSSASSTGMSTEWTLESAQVGMTGRHPDLHCSLSDHFSVECTLTRLTPSSPDDAVLGAPETSSVGQYLPPSTYDDILEMTHKYMRREQIQRKLRLGHMGYQLLLSIGCHIGVWWAPYPFVAFILMLVSTVGLSVGIIDGLMGGLFIGSEMRALKEFEWEVQTARGLAEVEREQRSRSGQGGEEGIGFQGGEDGIKFHGGAES